MKLAVVVMLAGAFLLSPARADETGKNAKIEDLMQLSHVERMTTQLLEQMKNMVTAQTAKADVPADVRKGMEEMQQKIMTIVADRLIWAKARPAYIKIYADTFSESEIDGILAFYKSPSGHAMLDKMPQLMQKSMEVGQQLMAMSCQKFSR